MMEIVLKILTYIMIPAVIILIYLHQKRQRKEDAENLSRKVHKAIDDIMEDGVVEMPTGKLRKRRWGDRLRERDATTHRLGPREIVSTNLTKDRARK